MKRDGRLVGFDVPSVLERLQSSRDHLVEAMRGIDVAAIEELGAPMFPLG